MNINQESQFIDILSLFDNSDPVNILLDIDKLQNKIENFKYFFLNNKFIL
jgi:hypothetical protein